jgi:murein DD-endopeptidase MepM/ murein hydrolase activator NlpD
MARLRLYYPVRPHAVNQAFGANNPCVEHFGKRNQNVIPSHEDGTCPIGSEKLYPKFGMTGHNGIDLQADEQPVYAACDGTVIEVQKVPARGLGIGILTDEPVQLNEHGTHFAKLRYWHLKRIDVAVGQRVIEGDQIGITNNTGYSSGNHLHFELQPIDKDAGGHPYTAFPNNGIGAAIDPAPFFCGIFAEVVGQKRPLLERALVLIQVWLQKLRDSRQSR